MSCFPARIESIIASDVIEAKLAIPDVEYLYRGIGT